MIGKLITQLLKDNGGLLELVPAENIYPYVMNEGTTLPAIIYTIDSLEPEYDKDGWVGDICNFSVISFSDNYSDLQSIVIKIREALELNHGEDTHRIILKGQSEGYNIIEDVFLNKLSFSIRIINN